ncbi:MAG: efflux RND transporter permease subunit [Lachnospiraceae bacterium]|nr:efflux RND transporter permease subunit [Candidatus Equihabitans merdae]
MEKFSVKKPFTILVAVIVILLLGAVSLTRITTDLMPEMNFPYLLIITPDPGASPERIEAEVSTPLENSLGTLSHVKNVYSVSSENYSLVQLEFEDGTDMDSAMVRVSSAINQVAQTLPDGCGTSTLMEISMDMVATAYLAVEHDGYDIYELSDYADQTLIPALKRVDGVASISDIGLVERTVQVELNDEKINALNDRILATTSEELDKALKKLEDAKAKVKDGQAQLDAQKATFGEMLGSAIGSSLEQPAESASAALKAQLESLLAQLNNIRNGNTPGNSAINGATDLATAAAEATQKVAAAQQAVAAAQANMAAADAAVAGAQANYDTAVAALQSAPEDPDGSLQAAVDSALAALNEATTAQGAAQGQLTAAQANLAAAQAELDAINAAIAAAQENASGAAAAIIPNTLNGLDSTISGLYSVADQIPGIISMLETTVGALSQAELEAAVGFATAAIQLADAEKELTTAMDQYEAARTTALANANVDQLVSPATLSSMIYAQNLSMPAGYIDDKDSNDWLLKIGDEFDSPEDLAQTLLCDLGDKIGSVRLTDVADVTIIDNAGSSYARLNGQPGIALNIFKGSTASTSNVSKALKATIADMEAEDPGLHVVSMMDQGDYIDMLISDILQSILIGALLAIIVLALFLKTVKPTLIVAISIPLSVLFAIVLMYFSDLTLNMMTLSGLALGIGMLVDNSIVVMENIYRLRLKGVPAPRAAVQGTKQVAGAIVSSTLTTVCIFVPMAFTTGTIRTLVIPLALSISYCLAASLIISMTVVPASASTILRNATQKPDRVWDRIQNAYGKALRFCLHHKLPVLLGTVALLVLCLIRLFTMGIIVLPETDAGYINVSVTTPEEATREESYAMADDYMNALLSIDGITEVGVMDAGSSASLVSSMASSDDSYGSYLYFITVDDDIWGNKTEALKEAITDRTSSLKGEMEIASAGMTDMSALTESGLSIDIYGNTMETLTSISEDVMAMVEEIEGFEDVSNGTEENEQALHLVIDKDKAMAEGLTVAQIFGEISQRLTTSVTSTSVTINDMNMDVVIHDTTNELTVENILDMEIEKPNTGAAQSGDMSAMLDAFGDEDEEDENASDSDDTDEDADNEEDEEEEDVFYLRDFATLEKIDAPSAMRHENLTRYMTVTATTADGYNTTLLSRELTAKLDNYELPAGYSISMGGESDQVMKMVKQLLPLVAMAIAFIYLVMVAQFQSLLSPFIVMFTIPLAFTGGMIALILSGQPLSVLSIVGFLILVGTIVNNGIVFVDYTNQLRQGGMKRHDALIATGKTRMRPILMTAMTTILAMVKLLTGNGMGSQMGKGMATVITGGLIYGTLMTLFVIPMLYDILFKKQPLNIDVGDDLDDEMDDAAEFIASQENADIYFDEDEIEDDVDMPEVYDDIDDDLDDYLD